MPDDQRVNVPIGNWHNPCTIKVGIPTLGSKNPNLEWKIKS